MIEDITCFFWINVDDRSVGLYPAIYKWDKINAGGTRVIVNAVCPTSNGGEIIVHIHRC